MKRLLISVTLFLLALVAYNYLLFVTTGHYILNNGKNELMPSLIGGLIVSLPFQLLNFHDKSKIRDWQALLAVEAIFSSYFYYLEIQRIATTGRAGGSPITINMLTLSFLSAIFIMISFRFRKT
jgi:hypothetical protein